jgi:hypothetical protein
MTTDSLISEPYRELNRQLHGSSEAYGASGHRWARLVRQLVDRYRLADVLDYGCGKQTLARALPGLVVRGYDPAFEALSAPPEPAELVVCGDVLEHVEPEHLDAVLDDLARCVRRLGLFVVATRPARKVLADGRNAHLVLLSASEWLERLLPRFDLAYMADHLDGFDDAGWRQRLAQWGGRGIRTVAPQEGEVVFLVRPRQPRRAGAGGDSRPAA